MLSAQGHGARSPGLRATPGEEFPVGSLYMYRVARSDAGCMVPAYNMLITLSYPLQLPYSGSLLHVFGKLLRVYGSGLLKYV